MRNYNLTSEGRRKKIDYALQYVDKYMPADLNKTIKELLGDHCTAYSRRRKIYYHNPNSQRKIIIVEDPTLQYFEVYEYTKTFDDALIYNETCNILDIHGNSFPLYMPNKKVISHYSYAAKISDFEPNIKDVMVNSNF
ncbi:MAG: hypothetical protein JW841_09185 [Deltaproteobacteria bacterium]|nr:hypothetical protein [Deltaproteobacteria bacterium]